jgi:hypothetical protein
VFTKHLRWYKSKKKASKRQTDSSRNSANNTLSLGYKQDSREYIVVANTSTFIFFFANLRMGGCVADMLN